MWSQRRNCRSLCVLRSVVSHLSKYCRWKRKHVEEEQTQLGRALIHFQRGMPPEPRCQARAAGGKSRRLWAQTTRQVPLLPVTPTLLSGLCVCWDSSRDNIKTFKKSHVLFTFDSSALKANCKLRDTKGMKFRQATHINKVCLKQN